MRRQPLPGARKNMPQHQQRRTDHLAGFHVSSLGGKRSVLSPKSADRPQRFPFYVGGGFFFYPRWFVLLPAERCAHAAVVALMVTPPCVIDASISVIDDNYRNYDTIPNDATCLRSGELAVGCPFRIAELVPNQECLRCRKNSQSLRLWCWLRPVHQRPLPKAVP
jgi:hypothetical protein